MAGTAPVTPKRSGGGSWEILEVDGSFVVSRGDVRFEVCPCCEQRMDLEAARKVVAWFGEGGEPGALEVARKLALLGRVIVEKRARKPWGGL